MYVYIEKIKHELKKSLPGMEVQYRMAPSVRINPVTLTRSVKAGVLILLYPVNQVLHTVFIKRAEYNGAHSGQISLPGGRFEVSDTSLMHTALRETREELGIDISEIELLGSLSVLPIPVSNFEVYPFIGFTKRLPVFKPDPEEVETIIQTGLSFLTDPAYVKHETMMHDDQLIEIPFYDVNGHHIWGATAMILSEFGEVLTRTGFPGNIGIPGNTED